MIKTSTRDATADRPDLHELDLIQEFLTETTAREQAMQPLTLPGPPPPPHEPEDTYPVILVSRGTAPQVPFPQSQLSIPSSSMAMPLPSQGQSRRARGGRGGIPAMEGRAAQPKRSDTEFLDRFLDKPQLEIVEQPKERGMRFRYECEGRSAGSILGASSTESNKTLPGIEIKGCAPNIKGIKVTVSLVTKDIPHRPHPHSLVGKDCADGICVVRLNHNKSCRHSFSNLGIQCVRRKELEKALEKRRSQKIDPFNTGHSKSIEDIDMNVVRLCFQCEVETESKERILLAPVVSNAIYDKKATTTSELKINRLNVVRGPCTGKTEIYLLCDKVQKDDIEIIFSLGKWEAKAEFAQTDVHRQIAIVFKSPPYQEQNIREDVDVNVFLRRLSDHMDSEPVKFTYEPQNPDPYEVNRKRKLKSDIKLPERCSVAAQSEPLPESLPPLSFPPRPYVHSDSLQSELVAPQMMEEMHYSSNTPEVKQEENFCPSLEMLDSSEFQAILSGISQIFESPAAAAAGFPQLVPGLHEHEQMAPQGYGLSSGALPPASFAPDPNSNYAVSGPDFYSRMQQEMNFYNDVCFNNYSGQLDNGAPALLDGLDSPASQPQRPCDNEDPALGAPIKTESHINL